VVVPTKNEAHNVVGFLTSIPPAVRLVIVDASSDQTPELIGAIRPRNTTVLRDESAGIATARNLGAAHVTTTWMLCTDADIRFGADYWLHLCTTRTDDDDVALYGGKVATDAHAGYYRWFSRGQRVLSSLRIPAASGSNMLIRHDAFEACGGFDPSLRVNEDSEIAFRLHRLGHRVRYCPDLVVTAVDHRRVERGAFRKTAHTVARNGLLFTGTMPSRWRSSDWGYWG
jgi:GT2 family glycosyltransferase